MNKIPLDSLCLVQLGSWVDDTLACCCFSTFGVGWGVAGRLSDNIARGCWAKGVGGVLVVHLFCILFCSGGVALYVILCYLVIVRNFIFSNHFISHFSERKTPFPRTLIPDMTSHEYHEQQN